VDLDAVADELYALPPEQFIAARDAEVKRARGSGDRALAARIGQLRRPTVGAWLVNLLVRRRRDLIEELLGLGGALRTAQATLAGGDLRRLSDERHRIVSALVREARQAAADSGHPATGPAEQEVTATLEATLADEAAAGVVQSGRLVSPLRYSGFGWDRPAVRARPGAANRPATATVGPRTARDRREQAAVAREQRAAQRAADQAQVDATRAEAERRACLGRQEAAKAHVADLEARLHAARQAVSAAADEVRTTTRAVRTAERRAGQARAAADRLDQ
jgi:hypothetical protein